MSIRGEGNPLILYKIGERILYSRIAIFLGEVIQKLCRTKRGCSSFHTFEDFPGDPIRSLKCPNWNDPSS